MRLTAKDESINEEKGDALARRGVTNEKPRQPTGAVSNVSLLSRKDIATCGTDETICLEPRESRGRPALAAGVMRVPKKAPDLGIRLQTRGPEHLFSGRLGGATFLPQSATSLRGSKSQIRTMTRGIAFETG
jgi:hypothetical protein